MKREVKFSVFMKSLHLKTLVSSHLTYRQARVVVAKDKADWRTALVDFDDDRYLVNPAQYKWLVVSEATNKVIAAY
jgi:hypothetical protein